MNENGVDPVISAAAAAMGRKGGKRRAETMPREERVRIATKASKAASKVRKAKAKARRATR